MLYFLANYLYTADWANLIVWEREWGSATFKNGNPSRASFVNAAPPNDFQLAHVRSPERTCFYISLSLLIFFWLSSYFQSDCIQKSESRSDQLFKGRNLFSIEIKIKFSLNNNGTLVKRLVTRSSFLHGLLIGIIRVSPLWNIFL